MIGQTISHYRIVEKLGGGGMGVVYKAEDTQARSLCRPEVPARRRRQRPAGPRPFSARSQAASALNHPNICTIYEIGEHDGQPFIAMEFLDGQTLRHRIGGTPLETETVLSLWPSRLPMRSMLRTPKASSTATSSPPTSSSPSAATPRFSISGWRRSRSKPEQRCHRAQTTHRVRREHLTSPGIDAGHRGLHVAGTGRGQRNWMPARTCSRSARCSTRWRPGTLPFRGETSAVIFEAILNRAPVPPVRLNPDLPPKLEEIINKALEKDRNLRYQHAADMRADLQRLKRDSESGHSAAASSGTVATAACSSGCEALEDCGSRVCSWPCS